MRWLVPLKQSQKAGRPHLSEVADGYSSILLSQKQNGILEIPWSKLQLTDAESEVQGWKGIGHDLPHVRSGARAGIRVL